MANSRAEYQHPNTAQEYVFRAPLAYPLHEQTVKVVQGSAKNDFKVLKCCRQVAYFAPLDMPRNTVRL